MPNGIRQRFSVEVKNDYAVVRDYGRGIPLESVVSATSGISVGMGANPKGVTIHPVKVTNSLSIDFYVASFRDGECSWAKYSKGNLLELDEFIFELDLVHRTIVGLFCVLFHAAKI